MLSLAEQLHAAAASAPYVPPREDVGPNNSNRRLQADIDALTALQAKPLNRGELGEALGVNASTVTKRINLLKDLLFVEEAESGLGRRVKITEAGIRWLANNPCA